MSRRRRKFTEQEVLDVLVVYQGCRIPCFRCGIPFDVTDMAEGNVEKEHLHEFALEGPDEPMNCRFSHKACHAVVTNGLPHNRSNSSKHRIAKTTGTRAEKFAVNKKDVDQPREQRRGFGGRLVKG